MNGTNVVCSCTGTGLAGLQPVSGAVSYIGSTASDVVSTCLLKQRGGGEGRLAAGALVIDKVCGPISFIQ